MGIQHLWNGACKHCQNPVHLEGRRARDAKKRGYAFCDMRCSGLGTPTPKNEKQSWEGRCHWCGEKIQLWGRQAIEPRRRGHGYCGVECARLGKNRGIGQANRIATSRNAHLYSARMRANNPMKDPATVEKMRSRLVGRTFLARGGNGKPTAPQLALASALGWPIEVAIITTTVAGQFPSLPHAYKVDVGNEELKIAIEVDGDSHKLPKWRFLDRRKESVLRALGWTVLRFWNEEVTESLEECVQKVRCRL